LATRQYNVLLIAALETKGSSLAFLLPTLKSTAYEKSFFNTHFYRYIIYTPIPTPEKPN